MTLILLQVLSATFVVMTAANSEYWGEYKPQRFEGTGIEENYTDCDMTLDGTAGGVLHHPYGPCGGGRRRALALTDLLREVLSRDRRRVAEVAAKATGKMTADVRASGGRSAESDIERSQGGALALLALEIGTPGQKLQLALDTGSDLTWTQCTPCTTCFSQPSSPFDPLQSSTYAQVPCASSTCAALNDTTATTCSSPGGDCAFRQSYGDGSTVKGDLAADTLTLGGGNGSNRVSVPSVAFGCARDTDDLSFAGTADGILGLGRGPLSFPSQAAASFFGGIFSMCLPHVLSPNSVGFIKFGDEATYDDRLSCVFTPVLRSRVTPTFYSVWVQAIALGRDVLPGLATTPAAPPPVSSLANTTIVDSGTTITRFPTADYVAIRDAFRAATPGLARIRPPSDFLLDTCFDLTESTDLTIPLLTFFFFNGLSFTVPVNNMVIPVSSDGAIACLAFAPFPFDFSFSIIGNYQTQGFLFTYDSLIPAIGIDTSQAAC